MIITIRASILPSYIDCPRRGATKIIADLIADSGHSLSQRSTAVGAHIGTAVHRGADEALSTKISHGEPCSEAQSIDAAMTEFIARPSAVSMEFDATTPNISTAERQVQSLTRCYYHGVIPKVRPRKIWGGPDAVGALRASAGDGPNMKFQISGHPDLQTEDGTIRDTKTGVRMRPCHAQVGCYGLLARANSVPVSGAASDFLQRVALKKPQPLAQSVDYDFETCEKAAWYMIERIKKDIIDFVAAGDPNVFLPNPMSMMCTKKYCSAWGTDWCKIQNHENESEVADESII